jgi:hypothetical protein
MTRVLQTALLLIEQFHPLPELGVALVFRLEERPDVVPPIVNAEVGAGIDKASGHECMDEFLRLIGREPDGAGESGRVVTAEIAVRGVVEAPPPEAGELADGDVDIPSHEVHQINQFGMAEEPLMTFDPGHGLSGMVDVKEPCDQICSGRRR